MKNQHRIIGGLMALCMGVSLLPVSAQAARLDRFKDIPKDAWYYAAVDHMVDEGYYEGISRNEFAPNATMTRAMFVTVLARYDNAIYKTSQSAFVDVPVDDSADWYRGAVNWAAYNKIVDGKGGGKFDPNGAVTREEICVMLNRYLVMKGIKLDKQDLSVKFKDAKNINTWADGAVKNCVQYGIVSGYPDNTFRPQTTATRAEVAAMIYRLAVLAEGGTLVEVPTGGGSGGGVGGGSGGSGGSGESGGSGGSGGGSGSGEETNISAGDLVGKGLDKAVILADKCLDNGKDSAANTGVDYLQRSGKKGVIAVESEAELKEDFSVVMVEEAVETLNVAVAATTGKELTESEIKRVIDDITDELGIPVSNKEMDALAERLAEKTEGLGAAMHKEMRNYKDGTAYPFTAICVLGGSGDDLYTVDFESGAPRTERSEILPVLAKELAGQMKESLRSHDDPTSRLDLEAELELEFTIVEDEALADCTDTVAVEIDAVLKGDGSVEYYYDEVDHLIVTITAEQQEEYDEKINETLQTALDKVMDNTDTEIPAGMDVKPLLTGEKVRALLNGDYDELYDDIDTVVGNMVTEEQIDAELEKHEEYDFTFAELVDTLERPNLSNGMKKTFKNYMVKAAVSKINEKVDGTSYEDAVTDNVAQYMAHAAINGVIKRNYPDAEYMDSFTEEAKKKAIDSGDLDALIDTLKEEDQVKDAIETAEPFEKLMTFDSMCTMSFEEFAEVMENKKVADAIDAQDKSIMEDFTAAFAKVPDGATVTVAGKKITASQISAMKKADTPKKARLAVTDVMETLGALTLGDFERGQDITVNYDGITYTMNMTIYAD